MKSKQVNVRQILDILDVNKVDVMTGRQRQEGQERVSTDEIWGFHFRFQVWLCKESEVWLIHTKLYTLSLTISLQQDVTSFDLLHLAALYICTRPQLQCMSWKEGYGPGKSSFCMPKLVLFVLHLGLSSLVCFDCENLMLAVLKDFIIFSCPIHQYCEDLDIIQKSIVSWLLTGHKSQALLTISPESADLKADGAADSLLCIHLANLMRYITRFVLPTLPPSSASRFAANLHPSSSFLCCVWLNQCHICCQWSLLCSVPTGGICCFALCFRLST